MLKWVHFIICIDFFKVKLLQKKKKLEHNLENFPLNVEELSVFSQTQLKSH